MARLSDFEPDVNAAIASAEAVAKGVAAAVGAAVEKALAPLVARVEALERIAADRAPPSVTLPDGAISVNVAQAAAPPVTVNLPPPQAAQVIVRPPEFRPRSIVVTERDEKDHIKRARIE